MKKVLIYSNGEQIGDGILKLQIVNQLKSRFPDFEIHWMTDKIYTEYNARLKKYTSDYIDKVWEKANLNPFFWKKISPIYDLESENFDIIIDTQKTVIRTMALRRIKNKKFISSSANWFFSDIRPNNISKKRKFYIQSIIEMLDLVSTFKDSKKSHITIPKEIVNELKKIFSANKKYLGISPGSNTPKRIWSFENYMNVAKYFEDKGFNIVYFLGQQSYK